MRELNGWHTSVRALLTWGVLLLGSAIGALAQDKQVVVRATDPNTTFRVDGRDFKGSASFLWPLGSKHILEAPVRIVPPATDGTCQYNDRNDTRWCNFQWADNQGLLVPSSDRFQTVTVAANVNWFELRAVPEYRVRVLFYDRTPSLPELPTLSSSACGAPGTPVPSEFRTGVVYVDGVCFWNNMEGWYQAKELTLNAFPFPGFVFLGWSANTTLPNDFLRRAFVQGPTTLVAHFTPAKRVMFRTSPPQLKVRVDRADVATTGDEEPCTFSGQVHPYVNPTIPPLCLGDLEFAPNTKHVIGAPSPQVDRLGKVWVFDKFSNGMGDNSLLEIGPITTNNQFETIVAEFVRGVSTSITTSPAGLKVSIDGKDSYPNGYFVLAAGKKITISVPSEQVDKNGRKWVFKSWSNGGNQTQEITVPDQAGGLAFSVIAEYEQLAQVTIRSNPAGNPVTVNGQSCATPCTVNGTPGTELMLGAPAGHALSEVHRMDFVSWSDGGDRERLFTFTGGETRQITANFSMAFKFSMNTNLEGAATVSTDPPSADGFYPADTFLTVTAKANPGYRFRRWEGDLSGSFQTATVLMSTARFATANFDKVPFISEAGIRNAAAVVPPGTVAPGSLIAITGANLAETYVAGPQNPLSQSVGGVSVLVGTRILPLVFVSPEQINAQLPFDLEPGDYKLVVKRVGASDVEGKFKLAWCAPGLFEKTFESQPWVLASHADGTAITNDSPAKKGETITLIGTGFGRFQLAMFEGFAFPPAPEFRVAGTVDVLAGELKPETKWAGGLLGQVGTVGVKFVVPAELPAGAVPVKVTMDGQESNTALLPVVD